MADRYKGFSDGAHAARRGVAVSTASDNTLADVPIAILVGVAGNIVGRQVEDTADVTYPVPAGYNPLSIVTYRNTGTTATGIVALYDAAAGA